MIQLVSDVIPIPRAPDHIIGVANIENSIIPLVDLEVLLTIREREVTPNRIVVIVSLEDTVFGLYMANLPRVITRPDMKQKDEYTNIFPVPDDWIEGYVNLTERVEVELQEEEGLDVEEEWVPLISVNKFWISLGDTQIIGPAIKKIQVDREERQKREEELRAQQEEERRLAEEQAAEEEERLAEEQAAEEEEIAEELENVEVIEEDEVDDSSIFDDESDESDESNESNESDEEGSLDTLENIDGIASSVIDALKGSGYHDLMKVRNASINDLTEIKGIGKKTAEKIKEALEE